MIQKNFGGYLKHSKTLLKSFGCHKNIIFDENRKINFGDDCEIFFKNLYFYNPMQGAFFESPFCDKTSFSCFILDTTHRMTIIFSLAYFFEFRECFTCLQHGSTTHIWICRALRSEKSPSKTCPKTQYWTL